MSDVSFLSSSARAKPGCLGGRSADPELQNNNLLFLCITGGRGQFSGGICISLWFVSYHETWMGRDWWGTPLPMPNLCRLGNTTYQIKGGVNAVKRYRGWWLCSCLQRNSWVRGRMAETQGSELVNQSLGVWGFSVVKDLGFEGMLWKVLGNEETPERVALCWRQRLAYKTWLCRKHLLRGRNWAVSWGGGVVLYFVSFKCVLGEGPHCSKRPIWFL